MTDGTCSYGLCKKDKSLTNFYIIHGMPVTRPLWICILNLNPVFLVLFDPPPLYTKISTKLSEYIIKEFLPCLGSPSFHVMQGGKPLQPTWPLTPTERLQYTEDVYLCKKKKKIDKAWDKDLFEVLGKLDLFEENIRLIQSLYWKQTRQKEI